MRSIVVAIALIASACGAAPSEIVGGSGGDGGAGGGGVIRLGLRAMSAGEHIGEVLSASPYEIRVWDVGLGVVFGVNPATGYVTNGPRMAYHSSAGCAGERWVEAEEVQTGCSTLPDAEPAYRTVWSIVPDESDGWEEGLTLYTTTGYTAQVSAGSQQAISGAGPCSASTRTACMMRLVATDVIPTSFQPPISIVAE